MPKKIKKLMIIDGHAFAFRSYFAFAQARLTNSKTGLPSGAYFGFFRMLFKILHDYEITHIAIAFDPGTRLDRNDIYEAYKANRKPMPEDLKPQIDEILKTLEFLEFPVLRIEGKEADDIIGSLCKRYKDEAEEILILSGDKDLYQVLDTNVHMLRGTKGVSEFQLIDPKWVEEEIGITTKQVPDYMGILGDSSDNIPGVKGIGEKGASALIREYGSLEEIYNNLDKITPSSLRSKLEAEKEKAFLSRKLATIDCDLNLGINEDKLVLPNYLEERKVLYFKQHGYNVLFRELSKQAGIRVGSSVEDSGEVEETATGITEQTRRKRVNSPVLSHKGKYIRIRSVEELKKILSQIRPRTLLSIDTETTSTNPHLAEILGISFSWEEGVGYYIPMAYEKSLYAMSLPPRSLVLETVRSLLEDPEMPKTGQNIKYDWIILERCGISVCGYEFDTMIASYLLDPSARRHNLDDMAEDYLNYQTITYEELVGKGRKKQQLYDIDPDKVTEYAAEDADITLRLHNVLKKELTNSNLSHIMETLEMPLVPVLKDMEMTGVSLDIGYFAELAAEFEKKIRETERRIHIHAGREFNIASTKELQTVLFDDLHLPAEKKTQTGFSTDHSVLESLQGTHPIIEDLLHHRKFTKLKSTYVDTLPQLIHPVTRRIHTSYNQTITATGRLSSQDPNLQNIPIKDEEGRMIRRGFIPRSEEYEILSLDYSQIELRIMAHYSQDPFMIEAYEKGLDIHRRTASAIFGVAEDLVTSEMRNKAKIVNFSIIYGATAYGLSQNLKISRTEAAGFIEKYFQQYPSVRKYIDSMVEFCEKKGYVETLLGRRRYIPDIRSSSKQIREAARRIAINTPIQGTSADMIKIAMINIHKAIQEKKMKSRIIMQVHDELVFEVHKTEKDKFFAMAKEKMVHALPLSVPVLVDGKFGRNWDEAH